MLSHSDLSEKPSPSGGLRASPKLGTLFLSPSSSEDDFLSLPPSPAPEPAKDQVVESDFLVDDSSSPLRRKVDRRHFFSNANASNRLSSLDRFVPSREHIHSFAKPFRLSKSPQLLSTGEKLLRRRDHSVDPFVNSNTVAQVGLSRRNTAPERRLSPRYLPHLINDAVVALENGQSPRQPSAGAVWNVGGPSAATGGPPVGVSDGHGGLLGSRTNAPMYLANFIAADTPHQDLERHESRLALALDIDQATRVLNISNQDPHKDLSPASPQYGKRSPFTWKDNTWVRTEGAAPGPKPITKQTQHPVPSTPFRVLDAPLLRDDFYCSALAYSYTARILAVGLNSRVYLWSEPNGVQHPPLGAFEPTNHVTSLSFSSQQGGHSILAVGRQGGQLSLWSTFDPVVRFEIRQPNPISCVSFKQSPTRRPSEHSRGNLIDTEDLAVGDDLGNVWYYAIEWVDDSKARNPSGWNGAFSLLAKISAHSQQICGLAWSPDGSYLATGGNDNACLLFELSDIFAQSELLQAPNPRKSSLNQDSHQHQQRGFSRFAYHSHLSRIFDRYHRLNRASQNSTSRPASPSATTIVSDAISLIPGNGRTALIPPNRQKHKFLHSAAIKAIAFAPWQPSLLATGGGSNDRCIHFYHTHSGSCLATINVHAQVTSLIWSRTRREIAATFGYAQPEHPFRIAVFAWPSCEQVVGIPWDLNGDGGRLDPGAESGAADCGRALWAISYPGGPNDSVTDSESLQPSLNPTSNSSSFTLMPISRTATPSESAGPSTPAEGIGGSPTETQSTTSSRGAEKEGGTWWSRTAEEGCIIVASSDETVKFHEIWSGGRKSTAGGSGLLGGSDILESLEGIEKEGKEVIR